VFQRSGRGVGAGLCARIAVAYLRPRRRGPQASPTISQRWTSFQLDTTARLPFSLLIHLSSPVLADVSVTTFHLRTSSSAFRPFRSALSLGAAPSNLTDSPIALFVDHDNSLAGRRFCVLRSCSSALGHRLRRYTRAESATEVCSALALLRQILLFHLARFWPDTSTKATLNEASRMHPILPNPPGLR
jgi:hypothetical protein